MSIWSKKIKKKTLKETMTSGSFQELEPKLLQASEGTLGINLSSNQRTITRSFYTENVYAPASNTPYQDSNHTMQFTTLPTTQTSYLVWNNLRTTWKGRCRHTFLQTSHRPHHDQTVIKHSVLRSYVNYGPENGSTPLIKSENETTWV